MSSQNAKYLESKIFTAPPHRLHLMLLEGAIRFGRQAEAAMRRDDHVEASAPLLRVIDIVGELLAGVRQQKSAINNKLTDLYWFLYRCVAEAKINADVVRLAEALKLLEYERQTWLSVCERMAAVGNSSGPSGGAPRNSRAGSAAPSSQISWDA
jgi:flagellar secretion chaperone FliS